MSKSSTGTNQPRLINLYFQVHQPRRLKAFHFFDVGTEKTYFDDALNSQIMRHVAHDCYLPVNSILLRLIRKHPEIQITFSISGTALDQFRQFAPEVLKSFRQLAETGSVEFLAETYYHSLASMWSREEFEWQVEHHRDTTERLIGQRPTVFRNTELIFDYRIAKVVKRLGFKGMYIEGSGDLNQSGTPYGFVKDAASGLPLMLRNYRLSDDIAFRFSDITWDEWPLAPGKFVSWLEKGEDKEVTCLGMDYETFGEHHKEKNGILDFLEGLLPLIACSPKLQFANPANILATLIPTTSVSCDQTSSWADEAKDLSAWLGNEIQKDAFDSLNLLLPSVLATGNRDLISTHRYLQTSDHLYYMCTKTDVDRAVHDYFSPHPSPYEAFMTFMNIISDLEMRVRNHRKTTSDVHGQRQLQPPVLEY